MQHIYGMRDINEQWSRHARHAALGYPRRLPKPVQNLPPRAAVHVCAVHPGIHPDRSARPEKTSASRGADRHAAYNPLTSGW